METLDERSMTHNRTAKPEIIYFAPCSLGPGLGGGARLRNMIDILQRMELNIHLISYLPGEKFSIRHELAGERLKVTTFSVRKSSIKLFKIFTLGLIMLHGLKGTSRSKVIFAHAPTIVSGLPALILSRIFRKPFVIDHMDIKDPDTPGFIYNRVLRGSAILFVISRYLEEEGERLGCRKVVYLPIFIDTDAFKKDDLERSKIRRELGINDHEIVIGYAGSFWSGEGVPVLLKAFKNLAKSHANVKLILVGGGNVAGSDDIAGAIAELGLEKKIILVPPQLHELMPKYLSTFDIACSPKIDCEENRAANPVKIYEYMAMGLPIIISAVGEPSKVIENGIDGFLVKPGDVADLESTLEQVIRNMAAAQKVGEKAREKILRNYNRQILSIRVEEALNEVLENKN